MEDNVINSQVYVDDIYKELTDEFQQIRTCMTMYISKDQTEGAMHLLKEITNNAIDECTNENSPSRNIEITFDEELRELMVKDEGRGIPFDLLVKVCKTKHTSTKFDRDKKYSKEQAGRNGVGMTVTTALSDYMTISSFRNGSSKSIEFIDGELTEFPETKQKGNPIHGTIVKFIPSEKYLGPIDLTTDIVENYLRCFDYILREDLKIKYYCKARGSDKLVSRIYKNKGLQENVKFLSSTLEFDPVNITFVNDNFDLDISFSYDKTLDMPLVNSYCNYIITSEGGNHEIASQKAICDFFCREAKKLEPSAKYEVTYDDCRKGLVLAINCKHANPVFEGQHKSKVSNRDLLSDGKRGITDELTNYFNQNNGLLRKVITYLRQIARARLETNKIKGITQKKASTFLDDAAIKGFVNIADRNYSGYKELIISEGDSAAGAILNARNSKYQAVFSVFGVINNVIGMTVPQIMQLKKNAFRDVVSILGCGIGKDFDINKLRWNKIIICTDSDVDGSNITSLISAFFITFLRELVDAGLVYKALPPLYSVNTKSISKYYKGDKWLYDKRDYYNLFNKLVSDNIDIGLKYTDSKDDEVEILNKAQKIKWLEMNSEYLIELDSLVTKTACNPLIVEYVCYYKINSYVNGKLDDLTFKNLFEKDFDEIKYDLDNQSLLGSYKSEYVSLIADNLFMKNSKRFMEKLVDNKAFIIYCKNKNDPQDKYEKMTIGQFLSLMGTQFNIQIDQRYKGVGEANVPVLFATTTNPKTRKLIRLNILDLENALEIFDVLHGKSKDLREQRRDILDDTKFNLTDIDN